MGVLDMLLGVMLHFTPLGYLLCAVLLIMRRKGGDKSRLLLAMSFVCWGIMMLSSLIYHYNDVSQIEGGILSMLSLDITFFAFFVMLLYPSEVIAPGRLGLRNVAILFSFFLLLNLVLLITRPEFRHLTSPADIVLYIGEYNVWLRVIVAVSMIFVSFVIIYQPYKYTVSHVSLHWVRWFSAGLVINTTTYLVWIITGSDVARLLMLISCLVYCLFITYNELFLRLAHCVEPVKAPVLESVRPQSKEQYKVIYETENPSPLWSKLIMLFEQQHVWHNPDITLVELASMLGTNRTTLSKLIRDNGYDGFSSLINLCRIREFMYIIEHQEITGIYETFFDVGFRSKSTAIRYFRQVTGTTPSDFMQREMVRHK